MGANKYENFECVVVRRSEIHGADYNPRVISEEALKKIRKWFRTEGKGQLAPITVNRRSMTVVSGHQRLTVLDSLNGWPKKDYQLTVAMTELDERTEVEANVFMNNRSAMGDFDFELLGEIHEMFPEISFTEDLGFEPSEVSLMFDTDDSGVSMIGGDAGGGDKVAVPVGSTPEAQEIMEQAAKFTADDFRSRRKDELKKAAERNNTGGSVYLEKDDFTFTVVCVSNDEKHKLMRLLHERETEKFIKSNKLYDIYDHKIKLRELS